MNNHISNISSSDLNRTAVAATLHCLSGCAAGEVLGLVLAAGFGWSNVLSAVVSIGLAFVFGYSLSLIPLLRAGLRLQTALPIVLAADTVSILTMEAVDTAIMFAVPGAMAAGLVDPLFWISLALSLFVAFWAAVPVNRYLLRRGKGHALVHPYHHKEH